MQPQNHVLRLYIRNGNLVKSEFLMGNNRYFIFYGTSISPKNDISISFDLNLPLSIIYTQQHHNTFHINLCKIQIRNYHLEYVKKETCHSTTTTK